MPFHPNQHSNNTNTGAAQGIFAATQALGSVGAPHSDLRLATTGTLATDPDALLPGSGNDPRFNEFQSAPQSDAARRPLARRELDDLRMPVQDQQGASHSLFFNSAVASTPGDAPRRLNISSIHQAMPPQTQLQLQDTHFASPTSGVPDLPMPLQPGLVAGARPVLAASYTAPIAVPHINTSTEQYGLPSRSNTMLPTQSSAHSYSHSSPAGLDQKYIPFHGTTQTPDMTKYAHIPSPRHYQPQTPSGAASYSPLALSDIRPRTNSTIGEDALGNTALLDGHDSRMARNCTYLAPWPVYAYDWCKWPVLSGSGAGRTAIGSYLEDPHNFIQILDTHITPQDAALPGAPAFGLEYTRVAEATCSYPVTRILWEPPSTQKQSTDLLATSGDHLRLWSLPQSPAASVSNTISRSSPINTRDPPAQKLTPLALLSNSKSPEHTAPLTSLDWNTLSPKLIITSSIDTTCTIWDIPTLTAKTQLIAHDKEVFDVRFCAGSVDVFVSCGADGSVRMFDLRSLEHSTIIYEPTEKKEEKASPGHVSPTKSQQMMSYAPPLLRLAASPHDSHLLATFASDSSVVRILDIRQPGQAILELCGHQAPVNSMEWSPSRRGMLASSGDDSMVLVWDLLNPQNGATVNGEHAASTSSAANSASSSSPSSAAGAIKGPAASWRCDYEVGNLSWAPRSALTAQGGEWIGAIGGKGVWGVKL